MTRLWRNTDVLNWLQWAATYFQIIFPSYSSMKKTLQVETTTFKTSITKVSRVFLHEDEGSRPVPVVQRGLPLPNTSSISSR